MRNGWVLVDTSAWLGVAEPKRRSTFDPLVSALQASGRIATNWLIRAELLTGARDDEDFASLDDELSGLHQLPLHDEIWRHAARLRYQLRTGGWVLPLADVAIASCAIVYGCEVLHLDRHFDLIAKHAPLKLHPPEPATQR